MSELGVLVVTGGGRGIGAATARLGAARGYAVCVNYRDNAEAAARLVDEIRRDGGTAEPVQADTAREDDIVRLFNAVDQKLGPVTALVNNAGIVGRRCTVSEVDGDLLREVLDVNVRGCFLCAREAVHRMATDRGGAGGAIVNISSVAAYLGSPFEFVHYAASKGAIDSFTIGLAKEVARQGIRVNAVQPGVIDTEIHASIGAPDRVATVGPQVPLGRAGTPEEVAEAVLWLLSDSARYVTGAVFPVSGGR